MLKVLVLLMGMYVLRMKSMVALLLALLLLGGASWASVCGLTCELQQTKLVCAASAMDHTAMPMVCGHCPGMANRNTPEDAVAPKCGAMGCGHALLQQARTSEGIPHSFATPHRVVVALVAPVLPDDVTTYWRGSPPREISSFRPLLVSLRI